MSTLAYQEKRVADNKAGHIKGKEFKNGSVFKERPAGW